MFQMKDVLDQKLKKNRDHNKQHRLQYCTGRGACVSCLKNRFRTPKKELKSSSVGPRADPYEIIFSFSRRSPSAIVKQNTIILDLSKYCS
jgi:hypothetical protein